MEDGVTGTQPGKLEVFEAMRLRLQRSNMLGVCRYLDYSLVAISSLFFDLAHEF